MQGQGALEHAFVLGAFIAGADEGHLGVLLHVQEVGAAQVLVAGLVVGIHAGGIDFEARLGRRRVGVVHAEGATEGVEPADQFGEAEVAHLELDCGVRCIDIVIGSHQGSRHKQAGGQQGLGHFHSDRSFIGGSQRCLKC